MPYITVTVTYRKCEFCGQNRVWDPPRLAQFLPCVKCGRFVCIKDVTRSPIYGPYCPTCFQQLLPLQQKILQVAEAKLVKLRRIGLLVFVISLGLLIPMVGLPTWMGGYSADVFLYQFILLGTMCVMWAVAYKIGKKANPHEYKSPPPLPLE